MLGGGDNFLFLLSLFGQWCLSRLFFADNKRQKEIKNVLRRKESLSKASSAAGWPDWANFRTLSIRLLWALILGYFSITFMHLCIFPYNVCTNLDKKWDGLCFGQFFSQTHLVTLLSNNKVRNWNWFSLFVTVRHILCKLLGSAHRFFLRNWRSRDRISVRVYDGGNLYIAIMWLSWLYLRCYKNEVQTPKKSQYTFIYYLNRSSFTIKVDLGADLYSWAAPWVQLGFSWVSPTAIIVFTYKCKPIETIFIMVPNAFIFLISTHKTRIHIRIAMSSLKTLYPGGIRTQTFCS
jgi:hypothetical protein